MSGTLRLAEVGQQMTSWRLSTRDTWRSGAVGTVQAGTTQEAPRTQTGRPGKTSGTREQSRVRLGLQRASSSRRLLRRHSYFGLSPTIHTHANHGMPLHVKTRSEKSQID